MAQDFSITMYPQLLRGGGLSSICRVNGQLSDSANLIISQLLVRAVKIDSINIVRHHRHFNIRGSDCKDCVDNLKFNPMKKVFSVENNKDKEKLLLFCRASDCFPYGLHIAGLTQVFIRPMFFMISANARTIFSCPAVKWQKNNTTLLDI